MRNRTVVPPLSASDWLAANLPPDMGSLRNRFSGRFLFSKHYFDLFNGDVSVLRGSNNKWLIENILVYSASKPDKNFIPVLQKIASDNTVNENLRQRSSEILEKAFDGKKAYNETRKPQTSDLLKLLQGKLVESKRQAICMIGKFRLTDMLQEVSNVFGIRGLEADTEAVMRFFGAEAAGELQNLFLKSSGNIGTSKAILRILSAVSGKDTDAFLFERLWSNTREIRETALRCLIERNFKVPGEELPGFNKLISETAGTIVWILSAHLFLSKRDDENLLEALNRELVYWKRFLSGLIIIGYSESDEKMAGYLPPADEKIFTLPLPELIDLIFTSPKKLLLGLLPADISQEKKIRVLQEYYPVIVSDYDSLTEDLLNRDYNQITIWTKASTLRNIRDLSNDSLRESVVALMFSPEGILQEEAARVVAGSDLKLFGSVSLRIPANSKTWLEKIINFETNEKELLFEKTRFLSSVFENIPEDYLLFLARAMKHTENLTAETLFYSNGNIIWYFGKDLNKPEFCRVVSEAGNKSNIINPAESDYSYYVLPLDSVKEFHTLYPEHSFEILKYIDKAEETQR